MLSIFSIINVGCSEKNSTVSSNSINISKAPQQIAIENGAKQVYSAYMSTQQGTRQAEDAMKKMDTYWTQLNEQKIYATNWTCRMTSTWDNQAGITDKEFPNPYYKMPDRICGDSDKTAPDVMEKGSTLSYDKFYVSKNPNLQKFYVGDLIYITGPVKYISGIGNLYSAVITADYVGTIPSPTNNAQSTTINVEQVNDIGNAKSDEWKKENLK